MYGVGEVSILRSKMVPVAIAAANTINKTAVNLVENKKLVSFFSIIKGFKIGFCKDTMQIVITNYDLLILTPYLILFKDLRNIVFCSSISSFKLESNSISFGVTTVLSSAS